jgi:protein gp37
MKDSKIEWTDHTFNPWVGCAKVSPGCDHCYAEAWAKRYGNVKWGAGETRRKTVTWNQPLKWNAEAAQAGIRKRVFCASLADVFDNEIPPEWRALLWSLVRETPHLDWLLLTKRIGNAPKMLPADWGQGWPNVWLGISVVNQEEADRDIPKLLAIDARIRFLSMEPLLGPVHFSNVTKRSDAVQQLGKPALNGVHWVIVGGESGKDARPMAPAWARSIRDQCKTVRVPFLFKQWGEWAPYDRGSADSPLLATKGSLYCPMQRFGKKAAGRLLDGREWNEFPQPAMQKRHASEDERMLLAEA